MPIETALEIAAALSDYVGDPALVAPVDAPSMHDEPEPAPSADEEAIQQYLDQAEPAKPAAEEPEPEEPPAAPPRPAARPAAPPAAPPVAEATPEDPEDTMATPPPFSPSGIEFLEPDEWEPITPLPPFEQPPERPLFADEVRRTPEAPPPPPPAAPPAAPPAPAPAPAAAAPPPRRRRKLRAFLLIVVALAVVAAMYVAFQAGNENDPEADPGPTTAPTTTPSAAPRPSSTPNVSGPSLKVAAIGDFDPEGDPQAESPGRARLAIDGNPSTSWPTSTYPDANFGAVVSGVGLILDLGSEKSVSSIEVQLVGAPTDVRFYASAPGTSTPPAELADAEEIGRVAEAGETAAIEVPATRTRYVIIWLTKLPADGAKFRGQIAEITVRS